MNVVADDANTTIYDDFTSAGAWPNDKWYRHLPTPDLWDPAAVVACGGGTLSVHAPRFTLTRPDGHDNVKALIYSTAEFCLRRRRPAHGRGRYAGRNLRY